jgi:Na+/melibiose symporter-like transporter
VERFSRERRKRPNEIFGLRVFYSAGPMLLYLTTLIIVWNYPITAARHAQLRVELAARGVRPAASE